MTFDEAYKAWVDQHWEWSKEKPVLRKHIEAAAIWSPETLLSDSGERFVLVTSVFTNSSIADLWVQYAKRESVYKSLFQSRPQLHWSYGGTELQTTERCAWHQTEEPLGHLGQENYSSDQFQWLAMQGVVAGAVNRVKRSLREWPICKYGGAVDLTWRRDGSAVWVCSKCKL